jgi:hypothetical protein
MSGVSRDQNVKFPEGKEIYKGIGGLGGSSR